MGYAAINGCNLRDTGHLTEPLPPTALAELCEFAFR